jgi:hypothetical protein
LKKFLLVLVTFSLFALTLLLGTILNRPGLVLLLPFLAIGLIVAVVMLLDNEKALIVFLFLFPALHFRDLWIVAGILLAMSTFLTLVTTKQLNFFLSNPGLSWAIIGFNGAVWLSIFFSDPAQIQAIAYQIPLEPAVGTIVHYLTDYLFLMIFYFILIATIHSRDRVITAVWCLVAFGFVAACFSLVQGSTGLAILPSDEARVKSFFKNSGDYSLFLQSSMALALGLFWAQPAGRRKQWIGLMLFTILLGWTYGFVRSSIVAFGIMLLFTLPYLWRRYQAKYALYVLAGLILILFLRWPQVSFSAQSIWSMVQDPAGTQLGRSGGTSLGFRLTHLQASWQMLRTHPWFGVGFGLSGPALSYYITDPNYEVVGIGQLLHTSFGRVAAETGSVGLFFYLLVMGLALKDLLWLPGAFAAQGDRQLAMLASGSQIAFIGHLVTNIGQPADIFPLFWVLIALTTALKRVYRQQVSPLPRPTTSGPDHKNAYPPATPGFSRPDIHNLPDGI